MGEPVGNGGFILSNNEAGPLFTDGVVSEDPETIRNTLQNLTVNGGGDTIDNEKKTKKNRKKSVSFSENDPQPNGQVVAGKNGEACSSSSSSSSSSGSSSSDSDCDEKSCTNNVTTIATGGTTNKPKIFTGRPIKVVSANRIRVQTTDGSVYEADRFCPHKKVDLSTWGQVLGNQLICTKHNWNFNLDNSGFSSKGRNIHACKVNDW